LTLALVGTIIESVDASAKTGAKDSRHGGVDVNEQVTCVGSCETLRFKLKLPILMRPTYWKLLWCQDALGPSTTMLSVTC
jgi:hypothetical protein